MESNVLAVGLNPPIANSWRDPGTLGDLDDLAVQLRDHVRSERARNLQDSLRVRHFARVNAGEGAIDLNDLRGHFFTAK
jgi:hypothetical protein